MIQSEETISKFVKIGKNSSMLWLTLIEDILNLSKIEAKTFKIIKNDFSIFKLLEEIYGIFEMQCEQK